MPVSGPFFTLKQAAEYCGYAPDTFRRKIREYSIPRFGPEKNRFAKSTLDTFIEEYNLPFPDLYDEGFHRIGCVVCPYIMRRNQGELKKHMNRWPNHYKAFEKAVYRWFYRSDRDKNNSELDTFEKYIEAYYRGFE